jgi:hypothetical protein
MDEWQRLWAGEFLMAFRSADAFRASSRPFRQKIAGLQNKSVAREANNDVGGMIASAVTLALSVELYLKTLQMISGPPNQGHELHKLYAALPNDLRQSIEAAYEATPKPAPEEPAFLEFSVAREGGPSEARPPKAEKVDHSLLAVLERSSRVFERWRYLYEAGESERVNDPYEFHYLGVAADVLHSHAERVCAGIRVTRETSRVAAINGPDQN